MKKTFLLVHFCLLALSLFAQPVCLHPDNPHYFLFRGRPVVIISSAEHYGAVINPAFDYIKYLNTLKADGMNYTRLFTGVYFEKSESFGIEKNTLAPEQGIALTPWKRSNIPGAVYGGNKFDLDQWNEEYFGRLKDFVAKADERGIIVEITLFSSIYGFWDIQPFNIRNNINLKEDIEKKNVQTLNNGVLMSYQEKMVRKMVRELKGFDNVIYEIQNEPWSDHPVEIQQISDYLSVEKLKTAGLYWNNVIHLADHSSLEWQKKIASIIVDEEKELVNKHLIAQNFCNYFYSLDEIDPSVSLLNFHYAYPEVISYNYGHNKAIGFDETGFSGKEDITYRKQAWRFIMAGGGLYNNLDYSFYPGKEDGTGQNNAPGGGSVLLRQQLKVLSEFIHSFDFVKMKPDFTFVRLAPGSFTQVLSEPGKQYGLYLEGRQKTDLNVRLPRGKFRMEWINTLDGELIKSETISHKGGSVTLSSPDLKDDIALKINKL